MSSELSSSRRCKKWDSLGYLTAAFLGSLAFFHLATINYDGRLVEEQQYGFSSEQEATEDEFELQHCNCRRKKMSNVNNDSVVDFSDTTCGLDAFARGNGQKVVAFSFYGNMSTDWAKRKGYFEGIRGNLELMPVIYPGWVMRVYFDLDPEDPILADLCGLACENPILDLCHAGKLPGTPMVDARKVFAMNWRFFPTLDPQVDVYNCRDLDSRINFRELEAVNEWLRIGEPVHSMRDHPAHGTPLLGAAWGADLRRKDSRLKWRKSWHKILKDPAAWAKRDRHGPDQEVLTNHVWPWARHQSVQHDAYLCKMFSNTIPWPVERRNEPNNYVAAVVAENASLWKKCPLSCRPRGHMDWEHC